MIKIDDVKHLSHEVVESHNSRGFALVRITPTDPLPVGVLLNVTKDPVVRPGKELKAKVDVRRFLWDQGRKTVGRRKGRTWIWSRYLKDQDVSVMGLAAMVDRKVADRMMERNEAYSWIEVQP
jgi:hypothetical protein